VLVKSPFSHTPHSPSASLHRSISSCTPERRLKLDTQSLKHSIANSSTLNRSAITDRISGCTDVCPVSRRPNSVAIPASTKRGINNILLRYTRLQACPAKNNAFVIDGQLTKMLCRAFVEVYEEQSKIHTMLQQEMSTCIWACFHQEPNQGDE
jgi:hypothetical protein